MGARALHKLPLPQRYAYDGPVEDWSLGNQRLVDSLIQRKYIKRKIVSKVMGEVDRAEFAKLSPYSDK